LDAVMASPQSSSRPAGKRDRRVAGPPPPRPSGPGRTVEPRGRTWLRAAAAVTVLVVALTVALWPRQDAGPEGADADPALVAAREAAALQPCPVPGPGAPPAGGRLAGLQLPCLGSPGTIDVGAAAADRPVLLNVWASWCVPCREEIPALQAYTRLPDAIQVLGVSADADPVAGLEMMRSLGGTYPSVVDADVRLRRELAGPPILPANYVLLPGGTIRRVDPPVVFRSAEQVREVLAGYLS
jgi:thiol-disulfide isomerase/thioredoxin